MKQIADVAHGASQHGWYGPDWGRIGARPGTHSRQMFTEGTYRFAAKFYDPTVPFDIYRLIAEREDRERYT